MDLDPASAPDSAPPSDSMLFADRMPLDGLAVKGELHGVLNAFQNSRSFGVYVCEAFRDPRKAPIDAYWEEVAGEAYGIEDLHRLIGRRDHPLSDEARARMHQFARLLERLSRRVDRLVVQ